MRTRIELSEQWKERLGGFTVALVLLMAMVLWGCDAPGAERWRGEREARQESAPVSAETVIPEPTTTTVTTPTGPVTFEEAETAYRERRYDEAVRLFTAYTEQKPENPWGQYMLGLSAWKAGQPEVAEQAFNEALVRDPKHVKSLINLSRVLLERDRPEDALQKVELALELDPESPDGLRIKGRSLAAAGRTEEAIEAYREAITRNDRDVWAMNNLGLLFVTTGQLEQGLRPLARAAELAPDVAVFHNNLGMALELAGYYGAAVEAYRAAVAADSSHTKAVANLARLEQRPDATTVEVDVAALAQAFVEEIAGWRGTTVVGSVSRDSVP